MRIFFGATLPDETKREIAEVQELLNDEVHDAKLEGEEKLHITLQFIGDFRQDRVEELFEAAAAELKNRKARSPLTEIVGISYFPNMKVRRGIWLDCRDDGSLAVFSDAVKSASSQYGVVPEDREFKPHITVARIHRKEVRRGSPYESRRTYREGDRQRPEDLQKFMRDGKLSVEQFFPRSVALFESTLKPSGSEYRILQEYSLEKSEE